MELFHTSPSVITEINKFGLFDDCLFFASDEYAMGDVKAVYSIELDKSKIIDVSELDHAETIKNIERVLECSEDDAGDLLNGSIENAGELTGNYEDDWFVQAQQGYASKAMGYEAVAANDEQGCVYIVPMFGREKDIIRIK